MLEFEVIIPKSAEDLLSRLLRYDQIADKHLRAAMSKSVSRIEAGARKNAPVGVTSRLRNSLASEVKSRPDSIVGRVGSTMKKEVYPLVIEKGRKFGSMPPSSALERWVRIKLRVPAKQVKGVAFVIARKIGRRGIVGRFFLRKAYFAAKRTVDSYFSKALKDITKELAHGR